MTLKVVWRCAEMDHGALSVMMDGQKLMLMLYVDNLDMLMRVKI